MFHIDHGQRERAIHWHRSEERTATQLRYVLMLLQLITLHTMPCYLEREHRAIAFTKQARQLNTKEHAFVDMLLDDQFIESFSVKSSASYRRRIALNKTITPQSAENVGDHHSSWNAKGQTIKNKLSHFNPPAATCRCTTSGQFRHTTVT